MSWRKFTLRKASRVDGSDRWTSKNGRGTPSSASRSETDVCVSPPALTIATSKSRCVQPVDERALVVRLEEVDLEPELGGADRDPVVDLVQRLAAVDLGLARAEQVEVRALEDEDARHARASAAAAGRPARTPSIAAATTASGTSSRTTTPSAVGSTQRRRPAACFLSVPVASSTASSG